VSLNIAIPNLVMDAVNLGYRVVLARDAVAGVPASYGEQVLENTLALIAEVVTTTDVIAQWTAPPPG
jgi:nicotinamidase-related amidase